ncbi:hypothetical protein UAY_02295 [Enterococcus moraviensis ATCC BAA-383]|uniref:Uncharacterized protein n=1 Tax=Enterococcus moraviensis ATCC BAA-383 TaxID=1158609 RepID=R2T1X7_9ENTE|nr:hypothetical protein [Enterococcus moraviensis]EOH99026.1 hypothetical protein UAY_02295 [Enterococcus moraviensis ATCC BAA-383]EOT71799.1 hypothetical protein I586_01606 [Enterococcus moraviensis ATCC BAA-383]
MNEAMKLDNIMEFIKGTNIETIDLVFFTENISYLDHKDITDFRSKKGLMQTKIIFKYNDAKVTIKTPQVVLTSKWQMTNLLYLKEKNFFMQ